MANVSINIANDSTYKSTDIKANGQVFGFMQVSGKFNYINVVKLSSNPFKTVGKDFNTWEEVEAAYKSADMQIAILSAKSVLEA